MIILKVMEFSQEVQIKFQFSHFYSFDLKRIVRIFWNIHTDAKYLNDINKIS